MCFNIIPVIFTADYNVPNINPVIGFVIYMVLLVRPRMNDIVINIMHGGIKEGPEQNNPIIK